MRTFLAEIILLLAIATCGCSRAPEFAPVEGTVTQGGRPVAKVEVQFDADGDTRGPLTTGWTDEQGKYRLRTNTGIEGAVVGQYRVCIQDRSYLPQLARTMPVSPELAKKLPPEAAKQANSKDGNKPSRFPPAFGRPSETPLRAEVLAGGSTIDLQIP
jgi:hypothetical protein